MNVILARLKRLRYLAKYYPEKLVMRHEVIVKRFLSRVILRDMIRHNANWVYNQEHGLW